MIRLARVGAGRFVRPVDDKEALALQLDDVALLQRFDGEVLASVLVTGQNNLGRGWDS